MSTTSSSPLENLLARRGVAGRDNESLSSRPATATSVVSVAPVNVEDAVGAELAATAEAIRGPYTPTRSTSARPRAAGKRPKSRRAGVTMPDGDVGPRQSPHGSESVSGRGSGRREANPTNAIRLPDGRMYHPQVIDKASGTTDVQMLRKAREVGCNVLLEGPPGCGKTTAIIAAFADQMRTVEGNRETDDSPFTGTLVKNASGEWEFREGELERSMRDGVPLFVDDVSNVAGDVLALLYPAMDNRRQVAIPIDGNRVVKGDKGFMIVAALNPGVGHMPEPLRSRFRIMISCRTDYVLARRLGFNQRVVKLAQRLDIMRRNASIMWAPQMRELYDFNENERDFGEAFAVNQLIMSAPAGLRSEIRAQALVDFANISADHLTSS